jgi:hypothetical protein
MAETSQGKPVSPLDRVSARDAIAARVREQLAEKLSAGAWRLVASAKVREADAE